MVRFVDFFLAFILSLFLGIVIAAPANAGGSISKNDFLSAIDDVSLQEFIQSNFKISDTGLAARVGPKEIVARLRYGHEPVVLHMEDHLSVIPCMESTYYAPHCLD